MKLIIQIPCWNEEATLPITLEAINAQIGRIREVPGVDEVEILIIDDGSNDRTVEVARNLGVDHVVRHTGNQGLAAAFQTGLDAALRLGADVIVNTDADNQYPADKIPDLIAPILRNEADIVIGARQIGEIEHFSPIKKTLQGAGSWVVRQVSGTKVPDAPSGFRALSREAALRLNIITRYTYTLETIIQAGKKNLAITSVPIQTNAVTRKSRLVRNIWDYVKKSGTTIVRIWTLYEPLKVFTYISAVFLLVGLWGAGWLLFHYFFTEGNNWRATFTNHLPTTFSTVLALVIGLQIFLIGLLADIQAANRRLTEDTLYRVKRMELNISSLESRGRAIVENLNQRDSAAHNNGSITSPAGLVTQLEEDRAEGGLP